MALRGEPEALQRFRVKLEHDRLRCADEAERLGPVEIVAIRHLVVAARSRYFMVPIATVFDVALKLGGIRCANARLRSFRTTPTREQTDARRALVVDDVLRVAARVFCGTAGVDEPRQAEPRAEIEQDILERAHVTIGLHDRLANRVGCAIGIRDRAVEQADAIVAFEVGRVRQHQIGKRDGFRIVSIGIDDVRDAVVAARRITFAEHAPCRGRVHRRIPGHVCHEQEQRIDATRIARTGIRDHVLQHAVRRERMFPRERLIDASWLAFGIDNEILWRMHIP